MPKVDHEKAKRQARTILAQPESAVGREIDMAQAYLALLAHQRGCVERWEQKAADAPRDSSWQDGCSTAYRNCATDLEKLP